MIDELIVDWITWHSLHDVALRLFVRQRNGGNHVGAEINTQDRDGAERQRNVANDEEQEGRDLRNVTRQRIGDRFL